MYKEFPRQKEERREKKKEKEKEKEKEKAGVVCTAAYLATDWELGIVGI
jgi:hypothetical protein